MATAICLNEIKICQQGSIGPNFIALLSHRYGSRALPTRIIQAEYEKLRCASFDTAFEFQYSKTRTVSFSNLVEDCYELDDNETPARFRLKYLSKLLPGIDQKEPEFAGLWAAVEEKLGGLLRSAAEVCYRDERLTRTEYERYFVSVTEKEVCNWRRRV